MTFEDKKWDPKVSKEEGNFDFIMGDDLDFQNPNVIEELYHWGNGIKNLPTLTAIVWMPLRALIPTFLKDGWINRKATTQTMCMP